MAKKKAFNAGKVFGIVVLCILAYIVYKAVSNTSGSGDQTAAPSQGTNTGGSVTPIKPVAPKIDGNTVFVANKPYPKSDYVKWIQSTYNNYTAERKSKGKTPDYPKISVDGIYGPQTANAVYRYMGKYHTSWNEFKARIDYFRTQL